MAKSPFAKPKPARLGRYALLGELASGGMATIYLARLEGPEGFRRTVALKRPHPHLARNKAAVTMFLDEARMAARIRHVNVVPTLDVVDEGGQVAIVMEYVEGEALSGLLQRARGGGLDVPLDVAARVACDVLEGLHAAHEVRGNDGRLLGLVHRDVSPHNVLVGVDGLARVLDFGVAKAEGRMYQTAGEPSVKGKLAYIAPEYLSKGELDRRSDVYSAAVVLWEMLAGRRLFVGRSELELMSRVLGLVVPPLVAVRPAAPPALAEAVKRGLSRDPDERFPDALSMARAIRDALPLAGNADVGAWVRSLAAESLAARADALARAQQAFPARGSAPPTSGAPTSEATASDATASHRRPILSSIDLTVPSANAPSPSAPRSRMARRSLRVAAAIACTTLVGLSWVVLWPRPMAPNAAAVSLLTPPLASAPPADSTPQAPAATGAPRPPQAPDVAPATPSASAPTPQPGQPPPPASVGAQLRHTPPAGTTHNPADAAPTSCSPPYTYDHEGVRHFKPQCLLPTANDVARPARPRTRDVIRRRDLTDARRPGDRWRPTRAEAFAGGLTGPAASAGVGPGGGA
ncbi:MAG TPA: protein kinase [Polyangiaceae bacterium]|nr:protein kinase [Polyangiaceae bacterium]